MRVVPVAPTVTQAELAVMADPAAAEELKHIDHYQHMILNDDVKTAVQRFNAVIEAEKHKN